MNFSDGISSIAAVLQKTVSIWLMAAFLLLMYFPGLPVNSIPLLLFVLLCLADWSAVKGMFLQHWVFISLILAALLLGVLFSYKPDKSLKGCYDFLRGAIIFFPALYTVGKYPDKLKSSLAWVCLVCALIYLGYVLYALFLVSDLWQEQRAFLNDTLGYFNTYGTSAALIAFVSIASLLLMQWRAAERFVLMLAALLGAGLLLFSGSRGSLVALFAGLAVLLLLRFRRHLVLVLSGSGVVLLGLWLTIYFNLAGNYSRAWVRGVDVSNGRLKMYLATLHDVWQHAKFFGFGPNTYKYLDFGQVLEQTHYAPHSVYVECFFSLGIVGSLLLLAAAFMLWRKIITANLLSVYPTMGLGLLCFLLVRGLVDMKLFGTYYPGALAIASALILANREWQASPLRDNPDLRS